MAYRASNAAYAYDMYEAQPVSYPNRTAAPAPVAPERPRPERPRLDVVSGEGLEANQAVSPYFTHVMKLAFVFVALFCVVGFARIALAGATTALLNNNAQAATSLEQAHQESSNLQVMRSVYGSETRIRDLATGTLGMVSAGDDDTTTLDFSGDQTADAGSDAASAEQAPAVE